TSTYVCLSLIHAMDAGQEKLPEIRASNKTERQKPERVGGGSKELAANPCKALSDQKNGHNCGQSAEDVRINSSEPPRQPRFRNAHDRDGHADCCTQQR